MATWQIELDPETEKDMLLFFMKSENLARIDRIEITPRAHADTLLIIEGNFDDLSAMQEELIALFKGKNDNFVGAINQISSSQIEEQKEDAQ